ncbi:MAG: glycosyltransferase family 2 protein [Chloroflexi bacterium]|nr:glycosyltransferase family 2 protein [Chloroflexota bacterium]
MLDLLVVIVNYNARDLLRDCLHSLFQSQGKFSFEVVVVDNASSDGSPAMLREEFPPVKLIAAPQNLGYSRANNLGLKQQKAEYYLLLNPDTVLPPSALEGMLDFMLAHPQAGIAGPKLLLADGSLDLACRRSFPTPQVSFYRMVGLSKIFPNSPRFARYNLTYLDPDKVSEVDSVVGAFMLIRREVLEEIGYLDEDFFLYGEDLDLAYRAKAKGWKVFYNPQVVVRHYKRQSTRLNPRQARYEFYRAMWLFYRKHYQKTTPYWLHTLVLLGILLQGGMSLFREALRPLPAPPQVPS